MKRIFVAAIAASIWSGSVCLSAQAQQQPVTLITAEEAALPPPKGAVAMAARGVTRGPKIEIVAPTKNRAPLPLSWKFQAFGGAKIDPESVRLIYLRGSNIDLTGRVKPFISENGIVVPEAQLPPGEHVLRVDLKDSEGRTSTGSFAIKVDP